MKVAVWIDEDVNPLLGGGFSYVSKLSALIDNREFNPEIDVVFVSNEQPNYQFKKEVVVVVEKEAEISVTEQFVLTISRYLPLFKTKSKKISTRRKNFRKQSIQKQLKAKSIDVIFYPSQSQLEVENFPFIATNWDIGHLSMHAFPEVSKQGTFAYREKWYRNTLNKSLAIFVESEAGKEELINYLGINKDRIMTVPMFPGEVVNLDLGNEEQKQILSKFNLEKNQYFFYPAQFWAHKNHFNLLKAFQEINRKYPNLVLVLTGSDKGNLDYIKKCIVDFSLSERVSYLGFVSMDEMYTLYKNATALVMPTFLGPTNMPLLEARMLECPVLCSDFRGHREQLQNGALYFDPLSSESILSAMEEVMDENKRMDLLDQANTDLKVTKFSQESALNSFEQNLIKISNYRNCWN